jgi:tetratricopeptide (TPR) repeat protein
MPKQKTDDLIQLIKSLTRAEKRHFRLFVKRNQASEDILFLQLFDVLDKQGHYDEAVILRKLPAIKKRQLSNLKAHLYKQLLISLRLLNKNHNEDIQIREMVDYAKVLYNKGLYRQALDILNKAKELALHSQHITMAMEVVEHEKHIESQHITRSIEGRADELTEQTQALLKELNLTNEFSNLSLQLYSLYLRMGHVRNSTDQQEVTSFFYKWLPKIEVGELDFYGKIYYSQSHVWYYHLSQEFSLCYRHAQAWVDLFEQNENMKQINAPLYLKGLHNLLNALYNALHYDRFMEVLQKLDHFPSEVKIKDQNNIEGLFFLYKYIHSIKKHFLEGTFTEGTKLVPELVDIIDSERFNWDERRVMVFHYRIACLYFGAGDFGNAIEFLNRIINLKNPDYREDIQCFARILSLIAHFELGNAQLVEYQVKSVYRFLLKMEDLHQVQREIFRFLRKTPRMHEAELNGQFIQLKETLQKISTDRYERRPFLYLDIISWLESKIENRHVQDIIRDKFLNHSWVKRSE